MNGITPEDLEVLHEALTKSSTSEAVTLVFIGILAFAGIIGVVLWILNTKLEPVASMKTTLDNLVATVNEMKGSLWTEDSLNRLIALKQMQMLQEHEQNCPCRQLLDAQRLGAARAAIENSKGQ